MQNNREYSIKLFDYYGVLLTDHQKDVMDEYFNNDLSMNEIADNLNISKSAVQDLIKRTLNQLDEYENSLKLIEKDNKFDIVLNDMRKQSNVLLNKYIAQLEKINRG